MIPDYAQQEKPLDGPVIPLAAIAPRTFAPKSKPGFRMPLEES